MSAPDTHTWLYLKAYPADPGQTSQVITTVLRPLISGRRAEISRWFFLRYIDRIGVHVRCRLLLPDDAADEIAALVPEIRRQLSAVPPSAADPTGPWPSGPGEPLVALAVYEPEYRKWGGPAALVRAEQVFQVSSEVALSVLPCLGPGQADRLAAALLVVDRVLDGFALPAAARAAFLSTHFRWWAGPDPARLEGLTAVAERSRAAVGDRYAELTAGPGTAEQVDLFVDALRHAVANRCPDQKPMYLVFHHLHLMLNRLGVTPPEEAVTSLLSRRAA